MGSSEAAFCGVLKRRRCAQRRRSLLSFSPPPPGRTSFFTQPSCQRCRAHTPRRCSPKGSSEAAFCGVLQGRRGDASRWARPRRPSAGFCRAAETMLADGLVRGGFLRAFPTAALRAAPPFPFVLLSPAARPYFFLYPAVLPTMPRATFPASFCPAGRQGQRRVLYHLPGWRSSALPFRPIGGAPGTAPLFLHPAARGTDAARPFPPMRTGGQSLPFSAFSPRARVVLLPLPCRPANDTAHGRRGDARRRARLRRPSTGFCRVAEAMLAEGLVRGGLPRAFAGPPRRCFPLGSSEAAFHGVFQCRRGDASRWARPRRASTGFCRATETMLPVGLVRGGFLRDFAGPPRRCFPLGSSEAAFCGVLQSRRGDASRWARPRRLFAGFCRAAAAVLPDGLV